MKLKKNNQKLIIGSAQFGFDYGISNNLGKVKESQVFEILTKSISLGIRSIDTAYDYGNSLEVIGKFINQNKIFDLDIISKISDGKVHFEDQWEKTVKSLSIKPKTILVHHSKDLKNKKFINFIDSLKKDNSIKQIGISIYDSSELNQILDLFKPDIIQIPMNILNRSMYEEGLLKKLKNNNIKIHARSIFLQGAFFLNNLELKKYFPINASHIISLKNFLKKNNLTLPEVSINWLNSISEIDKLIIGITTVNELETNIKYISKNIEKSLYKEIMKFKIEDKNFLDPRLWKI